MTSSANRILTIDDHAILRESVSAYLEDQGFIALEAENGRVGLEIIRRERPDLVLLDLRMPEMGGLEVLKAISEDSAETPVIVISGTGVMTDVVEALRLGAWDYLIKPIDEMSILEHSVRQALERARLIRENRLRRELLEREVRKRTAALAAANLALERKNIALQEIMSNIQAGKETVGKNVMSSVEKVIVPMLDSLRPGLSVRQQRLLAQIERGLEEITSPFVHNLSQEFASLTPAEVRICSLIQRGLVTKEIAQLERISSGTVSVHRRNIRRKLGITNRGVNLRTHLETRAADSAPGQASRDA